MNRKLQSVCKAAATDALFIDAAGGAPLIPQAA